MTEACWMIKKTDSRIKEDDPTKGIFRKTYTGQIFTSARAACAELGKIESEYWYDGDFDMSDWLDVDHVIIAVDDGRIEYEVIDCQITMPDL